MIKEKIFIIAGFWTKTLTKRTKPLQKPTTFKVEYIHVFFHFNKQKRLFPGPTNETILLANNQHWKGHFCD